MANLDFTETLAAVIRDGDKLEDETFFTVRSFVDLTGWVMRASFEETLYQDHVTIIMHVMDTMGDEARAHMRDTIRDNTELTVF